MTARVRRLLGRFAALPLAALYLWTLIRSARTLGFSRDESFYFDAARRYMPWFELLVKSPKLAFDPSHIDAAWRANHEHPPLAKSAFALSHWLFYEKLHLFADASTAYRLPGMLFAVGCLLWIYREARARAGTLAAWVAALLFIGLPRVFYNAQLACFDVPVMAFWAFTLGAWQHAIERRSWRSALWFGVLVGLCLATKHNAWMLPAVIVPHALYISFTRRRRGAGQAEVAWRPLLAGLTLGPAVFFASWPWIWHDTLARLRWYAGFHLNHEYYNMEFLGRNYFGPPSPIGYMPVMILATVPTITLLLAVVGLVLGGRQLWRALRRGGRSARGGLPKVSERLVFDLLALAVPLGPFLLPSTPIFGGTKHWFPAYPFLLLFAARGAAPVLRSLGAWLRARASLPVVQRLALGACVLALVAAPLAETRHSHPFALSSYVPLVGGAEGAATLGLNRQFWGFTTQSLGPWFERETKVGDRIFIHDTTQGAWAQMQTEGRVPKGRRGVLSPSESNVGIVHHELHMAEAEANLMTVYRTGTPVHVLTHDGVPIITVYKKR